MKTFATLCLAALCVGGTVPVQAANPPSRDRILAEAAQGSPDALAQLGEMYETGAGVPLDYAQARMWYEKAAAAGYAPAMTNIGTLYFEGHGVPRDLALARAWWEKAAAAGDDKARRNLRDMPR